MFFRTFALPNKYKGLNMNSVKNQKKDVIGSAYDIVSFHINVIKACNEKGIEVPTREQICEYINHYELNLNEFMADYIHHEGMFRCLRTPLEDFKASISEITWGSNAPTEDEILAFFNKNGNYIELFCDQRTINQMQPLERKIYLKTIEALPTEGLAGLWNLFIEESANYGEDSHIYDLEDSDDIKFLREHMDKIELETISKLEENGVRYVQWFSLNNNSIQGRSEENIKHIITAFWGEIFERIMIYPSCYMLSWASSWVSITLKKLFGQL